jgi:hypothetical protein
MAVWRISYMLVWEDGPFDILEKFRRKIGIGYDTEGERGVYSGPLLRTTVAKLFLCVYCMSVWWAFGFTILYYIQPFLAVALAVPFALSTGAILVNRWCDYGES